MKKNSVFTIANIVTRVTCTKCVYCNFYYFEPKITVFLCVSWKENEMGTLMYL